MWLSISLIIYSENWGFVSKSQWTWNILVHCYRGITYRPVSVCHKSGVLSKRIDGIWSVFFHGCFFGPILHCVLRKIWYLHKGTYVSIRPVCMFHLWTAAAACGRFAAVGRAGRRYRSIAAPATARSMQQYGEQQQMRAVSLCRLT